MVQNTVPVCCTSPLKKQLLANVPTSNLEFPQLGGRYHVTDNKPKLLNDALILQEMLYRSEQNPVYVLEAIAQASLTESALPTWVLDYLAQVSVEIMALRESPPTRKGPALTNALGFTNKDAPRSAFKNAQKIAHEFRLAAAVHIRICDGDKEYFAIEETAKAQETPISTVRRAYKGWHARIERHEELLDQEE